VAVGSAHGAPGARVSIGVALHTNGRQIGGVQNDLTFDGATAVSARADGQPDCTVNPTIHKAASGFSCVATEGESCLTMRAIIVATDNVEPIADGATLYTCTIVIARDAPPGSHPLTVSRVVAASPRGGNVPALGENGLVFVDAMASTSCPGDCDESGGVDVAEMLAAVNAALGDSPVDSCTAADVNRDGQITIDEILSAVQSAMMGCE
jgi:hypothetical protein